MLSQQARLVMGRGEEPLFRLIVAIFKADQATSAFEHRAALVVQYLLSMISTCSIESMFHTTRIRWESINTSMIVASAILSFACFCIISYCLVRHKKIKFADKTPVSISLAVRAGYLSKKVAFPLAIWAFMSACLTSELSTSMFTLGSIAVALSGMQAVFNIYLVCNTIPSLSVMTSLDQKYMLHLYVFSMLANVLGMYGQYSSSFRLALTLKVAVLLVEIFQLAYYAFNQCFWDKTQNLWFIDLQFLLVLCNIWDLSTFLGGPPFYMYCLSLVVTPFGMRIAHNISNFVSQEDFFNPNLPARRRVYGLIHMEKLIASKRRGEYQESSSLNALSYYESLIRRHFHKNSDDNQVSSDMVKFTLADKKALYKWMVGYITSLKDEYLLLGLALKLLLVNTFDDVVILIQVMVRFRTLCQHSLTRRLELFHVTSLFEAKMKAFYDSKFDLLSQESNSISLENQYTQLILLSAQNRLDHFDVYTPLAHKKLFEDLHSQIVSIFLANVDIFDYISTSRNKGGNLDGLFLLNLNRKSELQTLQIESLISKKFNKLRLPPSYFFPVLKVYQRTINNDPVKANKCFLSFKRNKMAWDVLTSRNRNLKADMLDLNPVVLSVAIQGQMNGVILDASPHAETQLGMPPDGKIVGHNVNELFVDAISERHQSLMMSSAGLESLLNYKRGFFIQSFSGGLAETNFLLKLYPAVNMGVTIIAALSRRDKVQSYLVLIDQHFRVLEAETGFSKYLGLEAAITSNLPKIGVLSKNFEFLIGAVRSAQIILEDVKKGNIFVVEGSSLSRLCAFLKKLLTINSRERVVISVDSGSTFEEILPDTKLCCRVEFLVFNREIELTKLFVTFVSRDYLSADFERAPSSSSEFKNNDSSSEDSNIEKQISKNDGKQKSSFKSEGSPVAMSIEPSIKSNRLWEEPSSEDAEFEKYYDIEVLLGELSSHLSQLTEGALGFFHGDFKDQLEILSKISKDYQNFVQERKQNSAKSVVIPNNSIKKVKQTEVNTKSILKKSTRCSNVKQNIKYESVRETNETQIEDRNTRTGVGVFTSQNVSRKESCTQRHRSPSNIPCSLQYLKDPFSAPSSRELDQVARRKVLDSSLSPLGDRLSPISANAFRQKRDPLVTLSSDDQDGVNEGEGKAMYRSMRSTSIESNYNEKVKVTNIRRQKSYGIIFAVLITVVYLIIPTSSFLFYRHAISTTISRAQGSSFKSGLALKISVQTLNDVASLVEILNLKLADKQAALPDDTGLVDSYGGIGAIDEIMTHQIHHGSEDLEYDVQALWSSMVASESAATELYAPNLLTQKLDMDYSSILVKKKNVLKIVSTFGIRLDKGLDILERLKVESRSMSASDIAEAESAIAGLTSALAKDALITYQGLREYAFKVRESYSYNVIGDQVKTYYTILIVTLLLIVANTVVKAVFIRSVHRRMKSALESFICLNEADLTFEMHRLKHGIMFLCQGDVFNGTSKMEEVRNLGAISNSARSKGPNKSDGIFSRLRRVAKPPVAQRYYLNRNHSFTSCKLNIRTTFKSIIEILVLALVLFSFLGGTIALMVSIQSSLYERADLRVHNMRYLELIQDMHYKFIALSLLSPQFASSQPEVAAAIQKNLTEDGYRQSLSTFSQLYQSDSDLSHIDICEKMGQSRKDAFDEVFEKICASSAANHSSQSILKFLFYEQDVYADAVRASRTLSSNDAVGRYGLTFSEWYAKAFFDQRIAHQLTIKTIFTQLSIEVENGLAQSQKWIDKLFLIFKVLCILIVGIPGFLKITHAVYRLRQEWRSCMYTFRVISQDTVLANQYVLVRYKEHLAKYGL